MSRLPQLSFEIQRGSVRNLRSANGIYRKELSAQCIIVSLTADAVQSADAFPGKEAAELAKRSRGLVIEIVGNEVFVDNDPFCSIPIYFSTNDGKVTLFSDFAGRPSGVNDLDEVGVWETLLLGGCVGGRTLYQGIAWLPAGSVLRVGLSGATSIARYFSYEVESPGAHDIGALVRRGCALIEQSLVKQADIQGSWLFGLSGGLDSRVTAAVMPANIRRRIIPFTFAYHQSSFEVQFARQFASIAGMRAPEFVKLDKAYYGRALMDTPVITGGHIDLTHGHMAHALRHLVSMQPSGTSANCGQLSNYYTDALFGYAASSKQQSVRDGFGEWARAFKRWSNVTGNDVARSIIQDMDNAMIGCSGQSFSGFDDWRYIVDRNPRFHMQLAFAQNRVVPVITPYASYELLQFFLSLPREVRFRKKIADLMLAELLRERDTVSNISSRFFRDTRVERDLKLKNENTGIFQFKARNYLNGVLRCMNVGWRVQNDFQTEMHDLHINDFAEPEAFVLDRLARLGVLSRSAHFKLSWKKWSIWTIGFRYRLVSLAPSMGWRPRHNDNSSNAEGVCAV